MKSKVGLDTKTYKSEDELRTDENINIVNDIRNSSIPVEQRFDHFAKIYTEFKERFPFLYKLACKKDFDYNHFNYMMNMRSQVINKDKTVEDASKEVGNTFYNMYMKK